MCHSVGLPRDRSFSSSHSLPLNARENRLPLPRILTTTLSSAWPPVKPPFLPAKPLPISKFLLPVLPALVHAADNIPPRDLHRPAARLPPRPPHPSPSSCCRKHVPGPLCFSGATGSRLPAR